LWYLLVPSILHHHPPSSAPLKTPRSTSLPKVSNPPPVSPVDGRSNLSCTCIHRWIPAHEPKFLRHLWLTLDLRKAHCGLDRVAWIGLGLRIDHSADIRSSACRDSRQQNATLMPFSFQPRLGSRKLRQPREWPRVIEICILIGAASWKDECLTGWRLGACPTLYGEDWTAFLPLSQLVGARGFWRERVCMYC
jgi:hypothetical protein